MSEDHLLNEQLQNQLKNLLARLNERLVGQEMVVRQVVCCLLAGGHTLIEGVPGLGKTLLVRALAASFGGSFKRIQFTPDLMPADVTGHALYDMKEGKFRVRKGPVFTHLLLADEINRAPAKTQASLLEVMQELHVTIEGQAQAVPKPFMVLATQNPLEQEGTYPLPEAELDRFLMKVKIDYPELEDELTLTRMVTQKTGDELSTDDDVPLLSADTLLDIREGVNAVVVDDACLDYAVRLVRETRASGGIRQGAGPRASIALIRCARVEAVFNNRDFVLPDDIKAVMKPVLRHRIILSADSEIDGMTPDDMLQLLLDRVEAPRV